MNIFPSFVRSLLLTAILSFSTPVVVVGVMLAVLSLVAYLPGMEAIAQTGSSLILQFLAIFGSGCPWAGVFTIGLACSFVGGLFDTYAFYSYQTPATINSYQLEKNKVNFT
ncbi:MAG: hypothetical protein WBB28_26205 [Crinalium sp.]